MNLQGILISLITLYSYLIIGYILLSWIPAGGAVDEIRYALGRIVEPYLGIFRGIIPPIGMIDISPIIAILVLNALTMLVRNVL